MILVTVGTNEAPFDRLLRAVSEFRCDEPIVVQHGSSRVKPANAECVDFLSFDELSEQIERARVVVTHAGVGSVMVSLRHRKTPLIVPRLKQYGEAVDDHQVGFARRFASSGLAILVENPTELGAALARAATAGPTLVPESSALANELEAYIRACVGGAGLAAAGPLQASATS